jgi:hypothetical protein
MLCWRRKAESSELEGIEKPEGSFLNGFLCLREKLAPALVLDLALFAPRCKVGAYVSFKKLASGIDVMICIFGIFICHERVTGGSGTLHICTNEMYQPQ